MVDRDARVLTTPKDGNRTDTATFETGRDQKLDLPIVGSQANSINDDVTARAAAITCIMSDFEAHTTERAESGKESGINSVRSLKTSRRLLDLLTKSNYEGPLGGAARSWRCHWPLLPGSSCSPSTRRGARYCEGSLHRAAAATKIRKTKCCSGRRS